MALNDSAGGIPRFPGPKSPWNGFLVSPPVGESIFGGNEVAPFDYYLEGIDVVELVSTGSAQSFNVGLRVSSSSTDPFKVFFGNQISPNTGLYFAWRGLMFLPLSEDLIFQNVAGDWSVSAFGFFTSSHVV